MIREYDLELKPTGRVVWLRRDGKPLVLHPTGLTWNHAIRNASGRYRAQEGRDLPARLGTAWQDGNLDRAVRDVIDDDSAINGCRPTFVTLGGRDLPGDLRLRRHPPRDPPLRPDGPDGGQTLKRPRRRRPSPSLRPVQPEHAMGRRIRPAYLRAKRDRRARAGGSMSLTWPRPCRGRRERRRRARADTHIHSARRARRVTGRSTESGRSSPSPAGKKTSSWAP